MPSYPKIKLCIVTACTCKSFLPIKTFDSLKKVDAAYPTPFTHAHAERRGSVGFQHAFAHHQFLVDEFR